MWAAAPARRRLRWRNDWVRAAGVSAWIFPGRYSRRRSSARLLMQSTQRRSCRRMRRLMRFDAGSFDAMISRFGVMFFDAPEAAFDNMRRAMRIGAKLAFVAWRSPAENPFMT